MGEGIIASVLGWGSNFILALQTLRSPLLDAFFVGCSFLADEKFFLLLVPVIWWTAGVRRGLLLCTLALLTGYVNNFLKEWVALPRPFVGGLVPALVHAEGYSFPSGHSQLGASMWSALYLMRPSFALGIFATAAVLFSGLSRSYLGVHYPSDVLIGWTLGVTIAIAWIPAAGRAGGLLDRYREWYFAGANALAWGLAIAMPFFLLWTVGSGDGIRVLGLALGLALTLPLWIADTKVASPETGAAGRIELEGIARIAAIVFGLLGLVTLYVGLGKLTAAVKGECESAGICFAWNVLTLIRYGSLSFWIVVYPRLLRVVTFR